jgi:hypothetical protein
MRNQHLNGRLLRIRSGYKHGPTSHIRTPRTTLQCVVVSQLLQRESSGPYIEAYRLLKLKHFQPELRDGQ